jgi:hypothetical protein
VRAGIKGIRSMYACQRVCSALTVQVVDSMVRRYGGTVCLVKGVEAKKVLVDEVKSAQASQRNRQYLFLGDQLL